MSLEPFAPSRPAERTADAAVVDAEVARVLDDWHDAAARADEERYFAHFAEGAVFLGTDATERWTVPQFRVYAHPHFAKGKAWTMRATRREITFAWSPLPGVATAWFDEELESLSLGAARGSGVLVRDAKSGTWKIAQYNLSIPIPNERFKDVKSLLEGTAR
jgi:hypothetical protein